MNIVSVQWLELLVRNLHVRQKIRHRFSCVEAVFQTTSRIVKLLPPAPPYTPNPFAHFHFPADECNPFYHLLLFAIHVPCTLVLICIPCIPLKPPWAPCARAHHTYFHPLNPLMFSCSFSPPVLTALSCAPTPPWNLISQRFPPAASHITVLQQTINIKSDFPIKLF